METKRSRIDIVSDMLKSIQDKGGEIKPTHLMYRANLAHRQLKSYLEELLEKEMVTKIKKKEYEYLVITDKGLKFLEKVREMKDFERMFGF